MYTLLGKTVWNRTVSGEINENYDPSYKGNPGRLNIYATICALFLPIYLTLYLKKIFYKNNLHNQQHFGQRKCRTEFSSDRSDGGNSHSVSSTIIPRTHKRM